ncbi:MAG TPA: acyl-CoA dehydrogenase family protein [Polyangiaceae bacterium]|nr:acyl-CoA dehydrogenase family protein [Polyangiaceae bacterium]
MDFDISPEMKDVLGRVRAFVEREVYPLEIEFASGDKVFGNMLRRFGQIRGKVKAEGLWAPQVPKEYGGMGLAFCDHALVSEELGRSPLGHYLFGCQAPDAGNLELLMKYGTDEQKSRWLVPIARGEIRSCFSMTEPDRAGSNPMWLDTTAVKDGSDYVINGRKWFTTGAHGATVAIVMAVTNPEAPPYARASMILVPTETKGFVHVRKIAVMGDEGDDYASHSELAYRDCRVPQSNLLGPEGGGFMVAQERLGPGRIHHAMRWIGTAERGLDLMCKRAATRELAPGKPLGMKQTVQEWIADSRAEINAARLMVLHCAWKIDKEGTYAAREEISCVKFFVANILQKVLDRAIQTHGALGLTDDTPLSLLFRHERGARIYDGPDEVHKSVVARRILKNYGIRVGGQE